MNFHDYQITGTRMVNGLCRSKKNLLGTDLFNFKVG